ncbi:hypothetical protein [Actinophytocola sp.]|uniref:hypothetical protein n=1 Tax=Actinophytocola sp. TaxID=1872138 RepID=UPI002D456BB6|nr:hypothetical protein [Actinophytocola sp.]HYQ63410.1 hypothetical protein [Actinophytocola sp.]
MSTRDEFMRASDAFSWYQESDPAMHATIVALAWLDSTPDWARLSARLEAGTRWCPGCASGWRNCPRTSRCHAG